MEDRIRILSKKLIAEQNFEKARSLAEELREELSRHIEALRLRLAEYPIVTERREIPTGSPKPSAALEQDESSAPPIPLPETNNPTSHQY